MQFNACKHTALVKGAIRKVGEHLSVDLEQGNRGTEKQKQNTGGGGKTEKQK